MTELEELNRCVPSSGGKNTKSAVLLLSCLVQLPRSPGDSQARVWVFSHVSTVSFWVCPRLCFALVRIHPDDVTAKFWHPIRRAFGVHVYEIEGTHPPRQCTAKNNNQRERALTRKFDVQVELSPRVRAKRSAAAAVARCCGCWTGPKIWQ